MPSDSTQRIATLRAELARHDELYYRQARPELSDYDYDRLKRELADLEAAQPELSLGDSPTRRVGDDRSEGFARVRHRQAMVTLDNTYDEAELHEFDTRLVKLLGESTLSYVVEPKIDGLAVSLTYENGQLVRAVTRGDGEEGDDVTANVRTIRGLPHALSSLPWPDVVEIRGEVYLRWSEFERINRLQEEAGAEPYANPRNLAAGTLKLLDPAEVAQRQLRSCSTGWGTVSRRWSRRSRSSRRSCARGDCPSWRNSGRWPVSMRRARRSTNWMRAGAVSVTARTVRW